jgi:hypothetical protein
VKWTNSSVPTRQTAPFRRDLITVLRFECALSACPLPVIGHERRDRRQIVSHVNLKRIVAGLGAPSR